MNLRIEYFGVTAKLSGASAHALSLNDAVVTVDLALDELVRRYPELASALPRCACAVNNRIVPRAHALADGDTLALLPPVSGG